MGYLYLLWLFLLTISWLLLLAVLLVLTLRCAWRGRRWRAGLAGAVLAGLLVWTALLPAIHRHRLQAALDRGGIIGTVPETLAGSAVLLVASNDSRRDTPFCDMLLSAAKVGRLWRPRPGFSWIPAPDVGSVTEYVLVPPGPGSSRCAARKPVADEVPRPQWLLIPEGEGGLRASDIPGFSGAVAARLGGHAARHVTLDYLLAPLDPAGRVRPERAALAGFRAEVERRPWWWPPFFPGERETLRPAADPALDPLRRLTCGGDWPCDY